MRPSQSEIRFLRQLWRRGRLSARELHDLTEGQTGWAYSSTRKTLDRMAEKGLLSLEMVHGVKTFVPVQTKLETLALMIRDFSRNVLDADEPLPAAAFARSADIDDDEIEDLERLLEDDDDEGAA